VTQPDIAVQDDGWLCVPPNVMRRLARRGLRLYIGKHAERPKHWMVIGDRIWAPPFRALRRK